MWPNIAYEMVVLVYTAHHFGVAYAPTIHSQMRVDE